MNHKEILPRLKKIEGQVKGIMKMIDEEKYCIDIINQISAVKGALHKAEMIILKNHINGCITNAIKEKDAEEKIEELMKTIDKFSK